MELISKVSIIALGTAAAIGVLFLLSLASEALPYALGLIAVFGICFLPSMAQRNPPTIPRDTRSEEASGTANRDGGKRTIPRWYPNQGSDDDR